ncbi:MAG: 3TM-type holin [Terriglobales bacterium]
MGLFSNAGEVASMVNPIVGGALSVVGKVLDNLYPDPAQRAAAQLELAKLQDGKEARELNALLQVQMGQINVNNTEAGSESTFKSCWRPFLGWMCGVSLAYAWLAQPLLVWLSQNAGWHVPPTLSVAEQMTIVGQMMGLASARTVEKLNGAQ